MVPPPAILLVQQQDQVAEEELHQGGVGVGLNQGEIDLSIGVKPGDHGYSRLHLLLRHRVSDHPRCPRESAKVRLSKPRLIDVDDGLLADVHLQQSLSELLSEDLVLV